MVRRSPISNMFAGSPVKPLQEHIGKVHEAVKKLEPFFKAVIDKDYDQVAVLEREIHRIEVDADTLKHELRINLPNSLFMPMPRERILDIVTHQDHLANRVKEVTSVVNSRKMQIPDEIAELLTQFVLVNIAASRQAKRIVNELDELVEVGFRGREVTSVEEMIDELHNIEYEADKLGHQINNALFVIEKSMDPIDAIFLYRMIRELGAVADAAQRVGARLELLLAR
ncbi:TIGR00153 family protein [Mariprofundus sp. KV]|uniref:TIGR00153 family protein n=1 Tax=Mariprofundus sp. KV TaxID=2608715 RepID=UPI00159F7BE7|nr:TIGR00153 family protein [Mariprofundus sp. KV]NWF36856.1 TIGR00153 family protein [Mariprofundus sp. KV]